MNDFREYSAAFHYQNDDIMHYGVKGMKWNHHKRYPIQIAKKDFKKDGQYYYGSGGQHLNEAYNIALRSLANKGKDTNNMDRKTKNQMINREVQDYLNGYRTHEKIANETYPNVSEKDAYSYKKGLEMASINGNSARKRRKEYYTKEALRRIIFGKRAHKKN